MAVLIYCIRKTHWSLPATFADTLHVEFSCLSHPSQPCSWQLVPQMTQNAHLLIICKYLDLLALFANVFWQGCFISAMRSLIWNNIHHVEAAKATKETPQWKQKCAKSCAFLCTIPLCVGIGRVEHDWGSDGGSSTQLASVIYLCSCQIWTNVRILEIAGEIVSKQTTSLWTGSKCHSWTRRPSSVTGRSTRNASTMWHLHSQDAYWTMTSMTALASQCNV